MKIKISADSTCDLPKEIIEKYNIGISPLYIVKDGVSLRDGIEISPYDIYKHVANGGAMCSTAAVNCGDYLALFNSYLEEHDAVIHFTISSSMSACCQNSRLIGESLGKVYTVDSENLTVGIGMLVIRAAELAADGLPPEEIVAAVEDMKKQLDVSFVIETLQFLYKGGRCSPVAALGANLLHLRPCIEVKDGTMDVGKKYRGALDKYLPRYIEDRLAAGPFDRRRAYVVDSGLEPALSSAAVKQVVGSGLFDEVLTAKAGCTISNHCGPNTLGLIFLREK